MSEFPRIILGVSSTQIYKNTDDNNLNFYNNNLNIISLDSSGNVGIGDTTPNYKLDVNGTGRFTSDLTVDANLIVHGTTVTMNTETMTIEDPLISLAANNSADLIDSGFYSKYNDGTTKYTGLFRDSSDSGEYKLFKSLEVEPTTTVNTSGTGYSLADLECANINLTGDLSINGQVQSFGDSNIWSEANSTATYDGSVILNGTGSCVFQTKCNDTLGFQLTQINGVTDLYFSVFDTTTNYLIMNATSLTLGNDIDFFTMMNGKMTIQDLQVQEGTIHLTNSSTGNLSTAGTHLSLSGNDFNLNNKEASATLFSTDDTERMRIDSSGNVGIGTNDPDDKLHIYENANDSIQLKIENDYASARAGLSLVNDGGIFNIQAHSGTAIFENYGTSGTYFYQKGTGDYHFKTTDSNTERLTILTDGNVGIGNTSPGELLDVRTSTVTINQGARLGEMFCGTWNSTEYACIVNQNVKSEWSSYALIQKDDGETFINAASGKTLHFRNGNSEKMTILSSGNVGIGITDPACKLEVAGSTTSAEIRITDTNGNNDIRDQGRLTFWDNDASGGDETGHANARIICRRTNSQAYPKGELRFDLGYNFAVSGQVWFHNNGDVTNSTGSFSQNSDERLKENIVDCNSQWDDIKNIRFRKYNFKNKNINMLGVIAQELELTSPGLVSTREDGDIQTINGIEIDNCKSVKNSIIYMKGMKALQEAQLRIEDLEKSSLKIKNLEETNIETSLKIKNLEEINTESLLKFKNLEEINTESLLKFQNLEETNAETSLKIQNLESIKLDSRKNTMFINNIKNNKNKNKVFNESTFSQINGIIKPINIIDDMAYIQYKDNNNNVKQHTAEITPYYYGVGAESLKTYFNIYDKDRNRFLPTIYKRGKLINDEIELYNHQLKENDIILVKFTINGVKYEEEIFVTEIVDTTHLKIDNTKLKQHFKYINGRNIFIYGTRQKDVSILNQKFLYSLSSLALSGIKELNNKVIKNDENALELINVEKTENTKQNVQIQSNTENVNNIAEKFNTLVQEHTIVKDIVQKSGETINKLLVENNNLKNIINTLNNEKELNKKNIILLNTNFNKQNNINQSNLTLLNEHIKKQQILINQLMDKMNNPIV